MSGSLYRVGRFIVAVDMFVSLLVDRSGESLAGTGGSYFRPYCGTILKNPLEERKQSPIIYISNVIIQDMTLSYTVLLHSTKNILFFKKA
jgi:hypothetical protein